MPRVLFVANWDWVLAHFRLPLARRLRDEGYEVTLCCPPGEYVVELRDAGFEWHSWGLQRRSMSLVREMGALRELARLVESSNPHVVHAFTIKPVVYLSLIVLWRRMIRRARRPHVLINNLTGLGYLFSRAWRARIVRVLIWPLLVVCLRQPRTHTVLMNAGDRLRLSRLHLLSPRTDLIRGTGVDTVSFTPDKRPTSRRETLRVLFGARLLVSKGAQDFAEAGHRLTEERGDLEFLIAGMPDHGNPESFSAETIEAWQRAGSVTWLGHVKDMSELLSGIDVVVLPSHYEGLPRILLEAAAAGCVLVASDIEGCREVVDHGRNGLLVPPGDPDSLTAAIRDLLNKPEQRSRLAAEARRDVVARFELEAINGQWVDLYDRYLKRQGT